MGGQLVEDIASGQRSSAYEYALAGAGGVVAGAVTTATAGNWALGHYAGETFKMAWNKTFFGTDPSTGDWVDLATPVKWNAGNLVKSYVKGLLGPSRTVNAPGLNWSAQIVGGSVWRTSGGGSIYRVSSGRYVQASTAGGQMTYELVMPPAFRPYTVGRPYMPMFTK